MKRRTILTILCVTLVASQLLLAGCAPAPTPAPTQAPAAQPAQVPPTAISPTELAPAQVPPTQAPAPTAQAAAATQTPVPKVHSPDTLLLATTTSTYDSGLLDYILRMFEKGNNVKVDVVAVGTGQAIAIGRRCDADVLLVHDRKAEDKFVADGFAKQRYDVMYNDFIVVGPPEDPAKIAGMGTAKEAFKAIMGAQAPFASRGDKSGTNSKELGIWSSLSFTPTKELNWYNALGQGMGETLLFSNEQKAYTLTDRGTYLSMRDKLPGLTILVGGNNLAENKDKALLNPYGILPISPEKCPAVTTDLANKFATWFTSVDTMKTIGNFGVDKFGQPLFYPDSAEYRAAPK